MALPLRFFPAGLALAVLPIAGCCVAPPLTREWLAVGFRTPRQAVETFQTAVRADSPELEYRCFSSGFRQRNHISQITWREVRAQLRRQNPWLRKGLSDASMTDAPQVTGDHAQVAMVTHGHHVRIDLVRDDFAELWSGDRLLSDEENVRFSDQTFAQTAADGRVWFSGAVLMPTTAAPDEMTDVHVGREWKIDSFESVEPPREGPARAQAAPHHDAD